MEQINLNVINNNKENLNNDIRNIIKEELKISKDKGDIINKELKPKWRTKRG